jgi:D-ribose pyranose/furanose isomerase RbsD
MSHFIFRRRLGALILPVAILAASPALSRAQAQPRTDWHAEVQRSLPLLGHRNWIEIVDSAYPLQISPGVQVIETHASELEVLREVLKQVDQSIHVRPLVYMDAELPYVPEADSPGAAKFREQVHTVLGNRKVTSLLHEDLLQKIADAGKTYQILVLKTNLTIPYTSVFLQLDCKYWSADAEARLRDAMKHGSKP